jgi:PAS domain S-box-containing protein/putative nucleotidyltransferase with HDIG domain
MATHPRTVKAGDAARPPLRVLLVEDSDEDAELLQRALRPLGKVTCIRAENAGELVRGMDVFLPDVILSDFNLPAFDGNAVLKVVLERHPEIPVIIVTGALGDEPAAELIRAGARDYVLKDRLARLGPAVRRAVREQRQLRQQAHSDQRLRASELHFRRLFESTRDGILMLDYDTGVVLDANPALAAMLGRAPEDLFGRHPWELGMFSQVAGSMEDIRRLQAAGYLHVPEVELPDGKGGAIQVELTCLAHASEDTRVIQFTVQDVSERKRAAAALAASEQRFRSLIEHTTDVVAVVAADGAITYVSPSMEEVVGYTPEETIGRNFIELVFAADVEGARASLYHVMRRPRATVRAEARCLHKSGALLHVEAVARNMLGVPGIDGIVVNVRDVTERRLAEAQLREAELELREAQRIARVGSWDLDAASGDVTWSEELHRIFGRDPALPAPHLSERILTPESDARLRPLIREALESGKPYWADLGFVHPDGTPRWVAVRGEPRRDAAGRITGLRGTIQDITGRRRREDQRLATLARVRAQLEALGEVTRSPAVAAGDVATLAREVTEAAARVAGVERANVWLFDEAGAELRCIDLFEASAARHSAGAVLKESEYRNEFRAFRHARFVDADDALTDPRTAGYAQGYHRPLGITSTLAAVVRVADRTAGLLCLEHVGIPHHWESDEIGFACQLADQLGFALVAQERTRDQRTLQRLNRALQTLGAGSSAVVHAKSEEDLLQQMCAAIVHVSGYAMAWAAYADDDVARRVRPVAWAGAGTERVRDATLTWDDGPGGQDPVGRSIRAGAPQIARDIGADPALVHWHEISRRYGHQSILALPIRSPGGVIGALSIFSAEPDAFVPDECELLAEMARDLSYGIEALRTKAAREHGARRLEQSLEATVQALARTAERRDPYTAGHQQRVAHISVAIARELGLPDERIHGLRLAATIHDIGKIEVPAELLSKPTRLTRAEYELIKGHAQAGYEILKDIEFPWPLADMVRQHHERLDGSGYPLGLKAEAILLESRIIAVADVVEAIASHRPYRPARGMGVALEEIEKGRGTAFDAEVVDAFLRLVRDKGYVLPGL